MPSMSGPSITASGRGALQPRFLDVGGDEIRDAVNERMGQAFLNRPFAPGEVGLLFFLALAAVTFGKREQPFGRVDAAVEHDVLARLAQFRIEIVVDRDLPGIDDTHVHAGGDGVGEEHRMHRLAHSARCRGTRTTRFDTPPETCACGRFCLIQRAASMKATP